MSKELIEQRIRELTAASEQSAANHNCIVGSLNEAKHILAMLVAEEVNGANAPSDLDPDLEPDLDQCVKVAEASEVVEAEVVSE